MEKSPRFPFRGSPLSRLRLLPALIAIALTPLAILAALIGWTTLVPDAASSEALLMLLHERAWLAGIATLVVVLISLAGVLWIGIGLSTALSRYAGIAQGLAMLTLHELPVSPRSALVDVARVDEALARAALTMTRFARFLPRSLMEQLARPDAVATDRAETRDMTVLVADLSGFAVLSASLPPNEVGDILNDFFSLATEHIEATGGTVDKFVGDTIVAFWGAPIPIDDHATRAIGAARAIVRAIRADNTRRRQPLRVRIGIDSGPLLVGPIGARGLVRYTALGEPVNQAIRLEKLGKDLDPRADAIVLASATTLERADGEVGGTLIGRQQLRSQPQPIDVYRLI